MLTVQCFCNEIVEVWFRMPYDVQRKSRGY